MSTSESDTGISKVALFAIVTVSAHCVVFAVHAHATRFLPAAQLVQVRIKATLLRVIVAITRCWFQLNITGTVLILF